MSMCIRADDTYVAMCFAKGMLPEKPHQLFFRSKKMLGYVQRLVPLQLFPSTSSPFSTFMFLQLSWMPFLITVTFPRFTEPKLENSRRARETFLSIF